MMVLQIFLIYFFDRRRRRRVIITDRAGPADRRRRSGPAAVPTGGVRPVAENEKGGRRGMKTNEIA
jgi:hypothetical protein